eukprot:1158148-Pelagomonas_calceolata.AAC.10
MHWLGQPWVFTRIFKREKIAIFPIGLEGLRSVAGIINRPHAPLWLAKASVVPADMLRIRCGAQIPCRFLRCEVNNH